ncbi:SubName: Full=Uncharacterized protein {ECO:0000313/EMBL:CCA67362.1} [Serendipita indica DSM 11827]|nr:SubName: Full=Uncharacterized protein {ECO:0000313/EMBL:CCA67362.1} [Serendipita indica DSM 11827]
MDFGCSSIDRIPLEVLRDVFLYHVWSNKCSPLDLLYVCKVWYSTAISTSSLWAKVTLGPTEDFKSPDRIQCCSLKTFALAIRRAGRASLDLTISMSRLSFSKVDIDGFTKDVTSDWVSRCHSLTMRSVSALSGGDRLLRLFYTANFVALERLVLQGVVGPIAFEMKALFEQLEKTAFRLESLVMGRGSSDWSVSRLPTYPGIVERLRCLEVETDGNLDLSKASLLDQLEVAVSHGGNKVLLPTDIALRQLTLANTFNFATFDPQVYESLTHLTLYTRSWLAVNAMIPPFPSLTHLYLCVNPLEVERLYAPRLQYLSIEGLLLQPTELYRSTVGADFDAAVITAGGAHHLTGGSQMKPGIPFLKRLLLSSKAPANPARKNAILVNLHRVRQALAVQTKLERIDYGVYIAYDKTRVALPHERRDWPVEWIRVWSREASVD